MFIQLEPLSVTRPHPLELHLCAHTCLSLLGNLHLGCWDVVVVVFVFFFCARCRYLAVVAFISCSAFLVYGYRVYRMFAHRHWKSKVQRRIASDIFIVTIFCTVCFLVRGVTNVVWTKTVDHLGSCSTVRVGSCSCAVFLFFLFFFNFLVAPLT